jgi:3-hydroxyacyl-[acyl-carrier-protein] dehydratase
MSALLDTTLPLAADHPALAGHFPGRALYPGVVLLDLAIAAVEAHYSARVSGVPAAKFLAPVLPGSCVRLTAERRDEQVKFELSVGATAVARGTLSLHPTAVSLA